MLALCELGKDYTKLRFDMILSVDGLTGNTLLVPDLDNI